MISPTRSRAFTLIELLVVAIIGLMATIAAASVGNARAKSRDAKRVSDLRQLQKALEPSYDPGSGYPVTASPITLGASTTDVLCALGTAVGFKADTGAANCDSDKIFTTLERGVAEGGLAAGTVIADQTSFKNGTCP